MFDRNRFSELIKKNGYTSKSFANALKSVDIDITEASVNAYRQGRASPRIEVLCGIAELLNVAEQELFEEKKSNKQKSIKSFGIPLIEINSPLSTISNLNKCPKFTIDPILFKHNDVDKVIAVQVDGDAMHPIFDQNDIVIVELLDEDESKGNNLYLVEYADIIQFKRVQYLNNDEIILISLNKDYPPINAVQNDCQIIGKILLKVSVKRYN